MCKGLIGKKIGMTTAYSPEGRQIPVTVIQAGPCVIAQIKSEATDGYNALQLGIGERKSSRISSPLKGHLEKSGTGSTRILKEVPVDNPSEFNLGQVLSANIFNIGERIDVAGISKGRGFSGVIKRHGFHGGKDTHGSKTHRIPGSMGCNTDPGRVIKGKRLPGRYGNKQKTIRNLEIVDIRIDDHLVLVKGAIPGYPTGWVMLKKAKYVG